MSVHEHNYDEEAQEAAELHLQACYEHILDGAPEPDGLMAPFCGCLTCQVRETLHAAEPYLRAMWESE
jgi:hypothetical protein